MSDLLLSPERVKRIWRDAVAGRETLRDVLQLRNHIRELERFLDRRVPEWREEIREVRDEDR